MGKPSIKKLTILLIIIVVAGIVTFGFKNKKTNHYETKELASCTITETVEASGTINPVKTVNIGSQVSGMISQIYVDFNSAVKKGQLLAQIDPSLFQAQVDKARGDLIAARANAEKIRSMLVYEKKNYERYRNLYKKNYVSKSDLDLAEANYKSNLAQLNSMNALIFQTNAVLQTNLTNLRYSKIISPVDGVVVSRNVDVGQTVAASFQTPTLFLVAQDLTKMQIEVNVSEADIGRIKQEQVVDYTLDGYPDQTFKGKVSQVRISPTTVQNVVTYNVIVQVDNEDQRLKPGMSANVSIIVAKKENVLCAPAEVLRYSPKAITGGKKYKETGLWILKNKKPERIPITTGLKTSEKIEIISDKLVEGDKVIIGDSLTKTTNGSQDKPPMRMF